MAHLNFYDFAIIIFYFIVVFLIAFYYSKKAGQSTSNFFLSGRNLPWYIAGTAMVATTFAADTPLAVTELVAKNGISGNWLWWNMAIGSMLTVFFFARLWRRAGIMTDLEFIELRYSGKAASFLRGFRAIYLGLFMNAIVLGWVNKAMEKIFSVVFPDYNAFTLVIICAFIIAVYTSASGLLGTSRTDSFQFIFAMAGCIILAVIVINLPEVNGLKGLVKNLSPQTLSFLPRIENLNISQMQTNVLSISLWSFLAYVGLQWWSSWYPGADPGGGGYIAQRMMSAKNEKHSLLATLWFTIAHYAIRPWPWILVALAALIILPHSQSLDSLKKENPALFNKCEEVFNNKQLLNSDDIIIRSNEFKEFYDKYENTVDPGIMYPKLMVRYLPNGLLGLLIAVFLAAYMSTVASQLNWGTSYIINDFYRRFINKNADEKHYVIVSRIGIILMTIFSLILTKYFLTTISGAWIFILNTSAGLGGVLILRWYWWRINAWSEISAMIAPVIIYPFAVYVLHLESPLTLYPIVLGTTLVWIIVTYLTKPVDENKLIEFNNKIQSGGIGWKKFSKSNPAKIFIYLFINWFLGIILVYSFLFGIGELIFTEYVKGIVLLILSIVSLIVILINLKKIGFEKIIK
ncbi:MAG: Na+:solute symporter [Melioribacter sp.]|uniref:sodium:solute symporter family protein n=1 Tax=Rosettibacter primus TaxID=3111523 RepID=UPI00247C1604|nr:Na+:solute symporter [Melioribacter sp.]